MQLNVDLPKKVINRVKVGAINAGVALNQFVRRACLEFLNKPAAERRTLLEGESKKITGRKIRL